MGSLLSERYQHWAIGLSVEVVVFSLFVAFLMGLGAVVAKLL